MNKQERYDLACANFLERHSRIKLEIDALTQQEADCLDLSLSEFREIRVKEHLQKYANERGIDFVDLIIELAGRSDKERRLMRIEHRKAIAEALNLTWQEYCAMNPHLAD
jgi:Family of unknown function (DUF6388)